MRKIATLTNLKTLRQCQPLALSANPKCLCHEIVDVSCRLLPLNDCFTKKVALMLFFRNNPLPTGRLFMLRSWDFLSRIFCTRLSSCKKSLEPYPKDIKFPTNSFYSNLVFQFKILPLLQSQPDFKPYILISKQ